MSDEPDFINDIGIKWWKHDILTRHAKEKLGDNFTAWRVEKDGRPAYLLLENQDIIAEKFDFEAMAFAIDVRAIQERGL